MTIIVLQAVNLPLHDVGLILAVDWFLQVDTRCAELKIRGFVIGWYKRVRRILTRTSEII